MQNKTDFVGLWVPDKIRQFLKGNRKWVEMFGAAAAGYVMANSFIFGNVAPFGAALTAALSWKYAACTAFGAVLGHVFSVHNLADMKYILAVLLIVFVKWLLEGKLAKKHGPALCVATAFVGMGIACTAIVVTMNYTIYDVLLSFAEVLLACGATYFFTRSMEVLELGVAGASRSDISCVVVSFAIVIMGFAPIRIGGLSVGRIISVIIILLCARYGGEAAGAIAGVTAGIAMGLSGGDYAYVVSSYAFGGLICGIFGHVGRLATASAFVVMNALTALFVGGNFDVFNAVFEIFAASVIFIAIPQPWISKLRLNNLGRTGDSAATTTQLALRDRLSDISTALKEISVTTKQVSEKLGKLEPQTTANLHALVGERVCKHCGMRTTCWQFHYSDTMNAINDCLTVLKREGNINRERMPAYFVKTCCKLDAFMAECNTQFHEQVAKQGVQRKVSKVRSVVTDQFEGMALMMDEISTELASFRLLDAQKTRRVKEYLDKEGLSCEQVLCYTDEFERIAVEVSLPAYQLARINKTKMTLDLCTMLEGEFELPQTTTRDKTVTLYFTEKATFTVELGAYQIASGGKRLCGDAYDYIRNQGGKTHLILSDGMGSGGNAAVDSSMASGLITRLLSVGVGHEAALKLVNSALLIKSGDESLATIDICSIDLFTGKTEFYKAGAAPTYILRGGKAGYVESTSLPAGILQGVAFEKSSLSLQANDIVVMVSDGVLATGTDWVLSELESLKGSDIQRICEKLAVTAKTRRTDGHEDDITVMASALKKGI